ncbi:hypothetical protein BU24DRAFT_952 [Aaosphaeria arxii CBS 175.79]|uniref:C2H2-type domain-containing protein n=1 Tax=Aaosphaeria arxii CBS 175.79 TaxID=1450172 RepID=A0A6A5Y4B2_9PLEO|nr:uncharacterized protein BU24DRAFT_952 [Aaosphaeria arxii CBS 175.79]KAF2020415.1 hypothetical protein BU24DRAFT_952 [Aaosphaeria arxii CBS 175.79]
MMANSGDASSKQLSSFVCSICLASFGRHEHLTRHLKTTHSERRTHACEFCGLRYKRRYLSTLRSEDSSSISHFLTDPEMG